MLNNLKSMAGLAGLLKDLPKIKARIAQLKERLAERTVTAEAGEGAVRVTATGLLRVASIDVDNALQAAREMAEREAAAVADELGLPLPSGGLGGLIS